MAVSKKLRWAILRRDNFQCRYCGATAQAGADLEVDHVIPRSRGGKDVAQNLVTACESCNSGKSDTPLCASPVDDVPQEVFRRVCAERGVSSRACPGGDDCDHELSLAQRILDNYDPEDRQKLFEYEQHWLDEGEVLPDPELEDRAAQEAYYSELRDCRRLERLVERLLLHHDQDRIQQYVDEADAHLAKLAEDTAPHPQRYSVFLATAVERFLDNLDKDAYLALPCDEQEEWIKYAIALAGSRATHPEWGWTHGQKVLEAAKVVRVINAGRHYPIMCRAQGEHITSCPRRAQHRVRVRECSCCGVDGSREDSGHDVCGHHVELLRAGKYENRRGKTLALLEVSDLAVSV